MSIRTIVFDFGNVLGFFSHLRAAEQLAAFGQASPGAIVAFLFGGQLEDDYESGRVSSADLLGLLRERFHLRGSDDELSRAFGDMFTPNQSVCDLVMRLKPRYRLLLLSNTNEMHYRCFGLQFAETLAQFDALVLSFEVGLRKPDPRVYDHCLALAGSAATECLFIDDLPSNIDAARACGWNGLVYRRGADLARELGGLGVALHDREARHESH
jgi:putative hydrolase of the HAD superfamily